MDNPKFSEEQLSSLLDGLFSDFESKHGANTSLLGKHEFLLTDRNSFAKFAKLNFMNTAWSADGQIVQMHGSLYARAVETLIQRGLLSRENSNPLAFTLSLLGYEQARQRKIQHTPSRWEGVLKFFNDHNGLIAILAIIVGLIIWWFPRK